MIHRRKKTKCRKKKHVQLKTKAWMKQLNNAGKSSRTFQFSLGKHSKPLENTWWNCANKQRAFNIRQERVPRVKTTAETMLTALGVNVLCVWLQWRWLLSSCPAQSFSEGTNERKGGEDSLPQGCPKLFPQWDKIERLEWAKGPNALQFCNFKDSIPNGQI